MSIAKKINKAQKELNQAFIGRKSEIEAGLLALLTGENVLFLGPPGTAKSMLVRAFSNVIKESNYFEWLLTKFTTPEEIFGPISLKELEKDNYKRITRGKLPESNIVFLDEIFKSSSAILNSLLTVVNERVYHNNGTPEKIPMISLFSASNELPESSDLKAVYDRFVFKCNVSYTSRAKFAQLLKFEEKTITEVFSLDELKQAQDEVSNVNISSEIIEKIVTLRDELLDKQIVEISDRKWRKCLKVLKAYAFLNGRNDVEKEDLVCLKHCLWDEPAQEREVKIILTRLANEELVKVQELIEEIESVYAQAMVSMNTEAGAKANEQIKEIKKALISAQGQFPGNEKINQEIKDAIEDCNEKQKQIIKNILKIEI